MSKYDVLIEFTGKSTRLMREVDRSTRGLRRFGSAVKKEFSALRRAATSLQGQIAGIGLSLGMTQIVKGSALLDKKLIQIGQTAGASTQAVSGLRSELAEMAKNSGQDIDRLADGFNDLVQAGQSWRAALESTSAINKASAVTGAVGNVLAGGLTVGATAFDIDLEKSGQALELLDKMVVAGRLGNAELENLSSIFSRVGVNAASAGMSFEKTLAFIETLSLVEKTPERLATLADSTMRLFTNLRYANKVQQATGVRFYNADNERRDAIDVLKDIKKKYDTLGSELQRDVFIQKAFGEMDQDTIKGLRALFQGNSLDKVSSFASTIKSASGTLNRDFKGATENLIDQAGRLKETLSEAADAFTKPIRETLADLIQFTLESKENGGLGASGKQLIAGGATLGAGAFITGRYGGKVIGSIGKRLMGRLGSASAGIVTGKAVEAATGVQPVFVTNWPANFGGGADLGKKDGKSLLKRLGAAGKKSWKWIAGLGGSALAGTGALMTSNVGTLTAMGSTATAGAAAGLAGSAWGGYEIGKMIDRLLIRDTKLDEAIDNAIHVIGAAFGSDTSKQILEMKVQIDEQRRVRAETNDVNTRLNVEMNRGEFF